MEMVNHPSHYNKPGRKECIEEMIDLYGLDAVITFCTLNSYKYLYRHDLKNGQEDLDKAKWYENKSLELAENNGKIQIAKHFGLELQMQQLIEEMAELTQAICKHKRKNGKGQSLDASAARHVEENLIEELADVKLVLEQVILLLHAESDVQKVVNQKIERTLERISDAERKKKGDETNEVTDNN